MYHYLTPKEKYMLEHLETQWGIAKKVVAENEGMELVRGALMMVASENLWKFANLFNLKQTHFTEYMDGVKTKKGRGNRFVAKEDGSHELKEMDVHLSDSMVGDDFEAPWKEGDSPKYYYKWYSITPEYFAINDNGKFVLNKDVLDRMRKGTRTAYLKKVEPQRIDVEEKWIKPEPKEEPKKEEPRVSTNDMVNEIAKQAKCCLCPGLYKEWGNSPDPLVCAKDGAKCCDTCNLHKVLPARLLLLESPCKGECKPCHTSIMTQMALDKSKCVVNHKPEPTKKKFLIKKSKKSMAQEWKEFAEEQKEDCGHCDAPAGYECKKECPIYNSWKKV